MGNRDEDPVGGTSAPSIEQLVGQARKACGCMACSSVDPSQPSPLPGSCLADTLLKHWLGAR